MIMIILGVIVISLTLYDFKKPDSKLMRTLKRVPGGDKNVDIKQTSSSFAMGVSTGVVFILIGVIAKILPLL
ncbi:hypothetical protein J45TS6_19890 [Paenibacillus sp. J45TS6]|uniref:hypothetical protein n=1 Tax=Paenibacillus sp. J45TS6 TaxID=2807196 RepID=UPI001B1AAF0A|nr:hypothetical protein [Paenibacillus sp. J45TS6]GIP43530.1 hypothetical protein J45TS6_19890 [Paenibacillus sp. J45TS6]